MHTFRECFGLLIGGLLNTFLSFPESSLVCAEIMFVQVSIDVRNANLFTRTLLSAGIVASRNDIC